MFDLQLFDEEVAENSAEVQAEENSGENSQAELPEGFEGLEEYKDEILQELSQNEQAQEQPAEIPESQGETPQYQSKDDEIAALKSQIDELKKQGEKSQPKTESPKPTGTPKTNFQQTQTPPAFSQMPITPEFMKAFNQATDAVAMKMTGMSEEDVKDLEFAEEGDEDLERWKFAKQQAVIQVQADIQAAQLKKQRELNTRTAVINSYNEFINREKAEADFQNVIVFASGTLFSSLPQHTQEILAEAFAKVENNQASPAEIMLVQNYFTQAKEKYRSQKGKTANSQSARKQAGSLPKVDNLNGANVSNSGVMSVKDLEKIIDETTDFDKLDPKIRKMFEG